VRNLFLDPYSASDIDRFVAKVLADLGKPDPPVRLIDVRESHQVHSKLEHFFTGGGIERRPPLSDGVLVTLSRANGGRNERGGNILRPFLNQATEDRVLSDLVQKHPDGCLGSFGSDKQHGFVGLPHVGRGRGGNDDSDVGRPNCGGGRGMFKIWGSVEK